MSSMGFLFVGNLSKPKRDMNMRHLVAEKRVKKRTEIDPFDMKYCLEFTLEGKRYECSALDRSPNGVAMLVLDKDSELFEKLKIDDQIEMSHDHQHSWWLEEGP